MNRSIKRALVLIAFGLVATTAGAASSPLAISGAPGQSNANCVTNCIKTYRENNVLKTVVLDKNGDVFEIVRTPLSDSAKKIATDLGQNPYGSSPSNGVHVNPRSTSSGGGTSSGKNLADADSYENFTYRINQGTGSGTVGYGVHYTFHDSYTTTSSIVRVTTVLTYENCSSSTGYSGAYSGGDLESVDVHRSTTPIASGGKRNAN
ncbi:hypothetical protein [Salinisphaera sp. Q1T1-3]|uniref:hypothetical protein n=1 Tax=Salinisphaera sp. Q1T1-3 TaxID=2321229 RepID=UPI001314D24C|nr:hypothetical protein [Salinisphaera sp. Q1T1-3]